MTDAQIESACLSFRHDYGLMTPPEQKALRFYATEWLAAWKKCGTYTPNTERRSIADDEYRRHDAMLERRSNRQFAAGIALAVGTIAILWWFQ
jgi:hypothetical protein